MGDEIIYKPLQLYIKETNIFYKIVIVRYAASKNTDLKVAIETIKSKIEADKRIYENALFDKEKELDKITVDKKEMKRAFKKAKNMLMAGTLANRKAIIENYVKQIYKEYKKIYE